MINFNTDGDESKRILDELLTCPNDRVYVVYQGELHPRQFMRARVPVPSGEIPGMVHIAATICIGSEIDIEYPASYTRSGVEVVFRPNMRKQTPRRDKKTGKTVLSKLPASKPFLRIEADHERGRTSR